ncbi:MAG: hypothetical protein JRI23_26570 [Deltaproteobacteria bacterium]|jgi:hypothetical protein|nr:hypothetical protein [Deltaproteobacteria bacterium]MBW2535600.1 hypothetical protein [Deltaproteobacteria bacterium]
MSDSASGRPLPATTDSRANLCGEWLTSFFERLAPLEPILRIILRDAPLSAELSFRGPTDRKVMLDFSRKPARISVDESTDPGRIRVAVQSEVMHEILLGRLSPGEALGRRQLLLRGAASDLASFVPLFDFAPLLYRDHLADENVRGFERGGRTSFDREEAMKVDQFGARPGGLEHSGRAERAVVRMIERAAYAAGFGVGVLRHRYLQSLSMFEVMAAMARGVDAASPPERQPAAGGERHG